MRRLTLPRTFQIARAFYPSNRVNTKPVSNLVVKCPVHFSLEPCCTGHPLLLCLTQQFLASPAQRLIVIYWMHKTSPSSFRLGLRAKAASPPLDIGIIKPVKLFLIVRLYYTVCNLSSVFC